MRDVDRNFFFVLKFKKPLNIIEQYYLSQLISFVT